MPALHFERSAFNPRVQPELRLRPEVQVLPAAPILVEMFDAIRKPEFAPQPWTSDRTPETYFDSSMKLGFYFHEALAAWNFVYEEDRVRDALSNVNTDLSQMYLKLLRRIGLILRSSYKMFDGWHFEPESLADFLEKLGTCNDWIKSARTEIDPDQFINERDLYALREERFGFLPATEDSFRQQVGSSVTKIENLTAARTISIKDFHKARKHVRHLMNIIQIPACFEPGQPIHGLFLEHYELSNTMGDIHDHVVSATLDNVQAYKQTTVTIPDSVRSDLETICSRHSWAR